MRNISTEQIAGILKALAKAQTSKRYNHSFSKCFDFNQAIEFCFPYLLHPAYKDEKQEVFNYIINQ